MVITMIITLHQHTNRLLLYCIWRRTNNAYVLYKGLQWATCTRVGADLVTGVAVEAVQVEVRAVHAAHEGHVAVEARE